MAAWRPMWPPSWQRPAPMPLSRAPPYSKAAPRKATRPTSRRSATRQRWRAAKRSSENGSALARGFEALQQQRQQRIKPGPEISILPLISVSGVIIAGDGVEDRTRRRLDVADLKRALLDAVGQDAGDLIGEPFLVRLHRHTGLAGQREIGRKHLGVFQNLFLLGFAQRTQPALEPRRR